MTVSAAAPAVSADPLIRLGLGFRAAKVLLSAVELGVFAALTAGPLPAAELAARVGLHPRGARDFLDTLAALDLLDRDDAGAYRNSPAADAFLDPEKPCYLGDFFTLANDRLYPAWAELTTTMRTGHPRNGSERSDDPVPLRGLLRARSAANRDVAALLADRFPWVRYGTVVEVGAGEGCVPVELARRHSHLTGGGLDRPPVRPAFEGYVGAAGLADRLRFHAGVPLEDALPPVDVLVIGQLLRRRGPAGKLALLDAAHRALPAGGAIVVYDVLIDDERRRNAAGLLASLNVTLATGHGSGYTGADCRDWLRRTGFASSYAEPLTDTHTIVVGIK